MSYFDHQFRIFPPSQYFLALSTRMLFKLSKKLSSFFYFILAFGFAPSSDFFYNWVGAQFCVCMFLDSRDKSLNMSEKVNRFHL